MTIPAYRDVDLALLLELVRRGGTARPIEVYADVARHFPELTPDDRAKTREDGRTKVFANIIHWARDRLRTRGLLDASAPRGQWTLLGAARQALVQDLLGRTTLPEARVSSFIDGDQPLTELLGASWARPVRSTPSAKTRSAAVSEDRSSARPEPAKGSTLSEDGVRRELMRRLEAFDGYGFEQFVGRLLDSLGFRDTQVVGRSGDGGVDVLTYLDSPLISAKVAVQVKRHSNNVGPKDISYLRDRWGHKSDRLLFVTTSDYTAGAREVAAEKDDLQVELITGAQLVETMIEHGLGVSSSPVVSFEIDEDYFGGI